MRGLICFLAFTTKQLACHIFENLYTAEIIELKFTSVNSSSHLAGDNYAPGYYSRQQIGGHWRLLVALRLNFEKPGIVAARINQFGVAAMLNDASLIEHDDLISHPNS